MISSLDSKIEFPWYHVEIRPRDDYTLLQSIYEVNRRRGDVLQTLCFSKRKNMNLTTHDLLADSKSFDFCLDELFAKHCFFLKKSLAVRDDLCDAEVYKCL
jgi:hypothetical protein